MIRTIYSCDLCGDEEENVTKTDYLRVLLGNNPTATLTKDLCRHCVNAIDQARGKQIL